MKTVRSKRIARFIAKMVLIATIILSTGMTALVANAAAGPSVAAAKKIGTGSIVGAFDYYSKDDKYELNVSNPVKSATYSFTSSNTKILTVKAAGTNAYLTGIKAGTATITCNQKLKGKTTKVGTCKVTVVNSSFSQDYIPTLSLGTGSPDVIDIESRNNDAVYTYVSDSANFSMKETTSKFDDLYFIKHTYTAKAAGTYTVTIKETYNKATRVAGKIKYNVEKATVVPEEKISLGSDIQAYDLLNNYRSDVDYLFVIGDDSIAEISVEDRAIKGIKAGTTSLDIYENAKTPDKSKLVGTCKVTVEEIVLESLECNFDETEVFSDEEPVSVEVVKEPSDAYGTIVVTTSDPKVATVSDVDEDGIFEITPVSAGTTEITITCGKVTKTQTFTVLEGADSDENSY